MTSFIRYNKAIFFIAVSVIFMCVALAPVQAGIVTSTDIVEAQSHEINRENLTSLLARDDVRQALEAQGVDAASAQQRVKNMTDTEIQLLAAKMDQLPAGSGLSVVEWLLIIIIIILIV